MLKQLTVKNYAIIDHLNIEFSDGLHTITGETGAGKSILLGALSLVLGQRADTGVLRDASKKAVIEAQFDIRKYEMQDFFEKNDLDFEQISFFRREITPAGKSRAFVNDTPVNLQLLKEISSRLVNVHAQHDTLELASPVFQLQMIDKIAANEQEIEAYKSQYILYRKLNLQLKEFKNEIEKNLAEKEYNEFLLNELVEAALDGMEIEALEQELKTVEHAEEIRHTLFKCNQVLEGDELNVLSMLNEQLSAMQSVEHLVPKIQSLTERLESASIELKDINDEIQLLSDTIEFEPEKMESLSKKLDQINRLLIKHQCKSVEELIELRHHLQKKTDKLYNADHEIESLEIELKQKNQALIQQADTLHEKRITAAKEIKQQVNQLIHSLGMPNAVFDIEITRKSADVPGANGWDEIEFLFSANPGSKPTALKKVASGGELSRLMLSIKSLVAQKTALPTLIFDEIDTGISGEIAIKVGDLLKKTAAGHQVISITHLPQIAARGDKHYFVFKETENGITSTRMRILTQSEREKELAKMLAGDALTAAALENARQLLGK